MLGAAQVVLDDLADGRRLRRHHRAAVLAHEEPLAPAEAPEAGCEPGTSVCTLVRKVMASQIHVVGERTIGRAAFTGNHQWIVHDPAVNGHNLKPEVPTLVAAVHWLTRYLDQPLMRVV